MGGIATDLDGATTIAGLYAAGECAAHRRSRRQPARVELAARVLRLLPPRGRARPRTRGAASADAGAPPAAAARARAAPGAAPAHVAQAGPVRDEDGPARPQRLARRAAALEPGARRRPHRHARALRRTESRGGHLRSDFPDTDPAQARSSDMPTASLDGVIDRALAEDVGRGDLTTDAIVPDGPEGDRRRGPARARRRLRPRGRPRGRRGGSIRDAAMDVLVGEGDGGRRARRRPSRGSKASARAILTAERTALNLLQRLSGHRHRDPPLRGRGRRTRASRSWTRARRRPGCGGSTSTPSPAAAARTTASTWPRRS